jgi:hypothetical protein
LRIVSHRPRIVPFRTRYDASGVMGRLRGLNPAPAADD